jgi:class 3 adenylate cyclase
LAVTSFGHRRKLVDAIAALRNPDGGKTAPIEAVATPSALSAQPQDRAERRQVTVMFSGLVGSTALSARMDPEDLRQVISSYQKCVAQTVQRFDGFVAKYMATASWCTLATPRPMRTTQSELCARGWSW